MEIGSDTYANTPGVKVKGISEIVREVLANQDSVTNLAEEASKRFKTTLAGHITGAYQTNKNARRESGMEIEMLMSLSQVNMEYMADELAKIKTGSKIYMGLTATKSRGARSMIKDILQPANEQPFRIDSSANEELPQDIVEQIEAAFQEDADRISAEIDKEMEEASNVGQPEAPQEQPQPGAAGTPAQPPRKAPSALVAVRKLKRMAELKRDVQESIESEINKISNSDIKKIETKVVDQLQDGKWTNAMSDFIEDFTIFPTAFMKGPVVTTEPRMAWKDGVAIPQRRIVFQNKRVSPLDIYPSPSAASIYDGNFIEHIRLTKKELSDLSFLKKDTGFRKASIVDVLLNELPGTSIWVDSEIEEDKALAEKRGSQIYASEGIYHGVHFWGTASVKMLKEWEYSETDINHLEDHEEVEIEAMMIGSTVIKCLINRDPLGRRPYYSASFQTRSGSIWGTSLPYLMRDDQRMCNACARALADNMGMASGPQVGLMVDRLADSGNITELEPRKIWQFTSDPTGNSGKPIEFFMVPSNAKELLAVYDKFEMKADDATGVPRYMMGNEKVGGAGQTAQGLSMLMESASKGIKSSIKNISEGCIVPRVEYQFYLHLLKSMEDGNPENFSGDINVVVHAAEAITIKAAEAALQKELLQTVTNEFDMKIVGMQGRGDILRTVFKGAGFPEDAIPSRLELKEKEAADKLVGEQAQAAQAQAAQEGNETGLKATQMQVEGQMKMHEGTQMTKNRELDQKASKDSTDQQLKAVEIQQRGETEANKGMTKLQETDRKLTAEGQNVDRKLAVELSKSERKEI